MDCLQVQKARECFTQEAAQSQPGMISQIPPYPTLPASTPSNLTAASGVSGLQPKAKLPPALLRGQHHPVPTVPAADQGKLCPAGGLSL